MLILLSNDDGIDAAGLDALREAISPLGELWVVAPALEQSATSSKITLREPLRIVERGERRFSVSGTPADCVYVALNHILPRDPDLCLSGINHGANLGDDVFYSGTVAAAIEAALEDIPSIAVSLSDTRSRDFAAAAHVSQRIARSVIERGLPRGVMLNVNVPPEATAETRVVVTTLGRRNYGRVVTEGHDPYNKPYYWIGGAPMTFDDLPSSDCNAVAAGHISVSPVQLDLSHYRFARQMRTWSELVSPER